jgi:hypothetical protein
LSYREIHNAKETTMTKELELGVWTADDCALVLIDYVTEVPKLTDEVGVAEAEKLAAAGQGAR